MARLPVIGLTGGIGGGKSEVAALLKERGAVVIDADAVGHELLERSRSHAVRSSSGLGRVCWWEPGGGPGSPPAIDRRGAGCDRLRRSHGPARPGGDSSPADASLVSSRRSSASCAGGGDGGRLVVLDAAILLEAGWDDLCD